MNYPSPSMTAEEGAENEVELTFTYRATYVGRPQPTRKIITGRRDCITGEFTSTKKAMGYRRVAFEGALAGDLMTIFDLDPSIEWYQEEAKPFRWSDGNDMHTYHPDVEIMCVDGRRICVEAKPAKIVRKKELLPLYSLIGAAALENGYDGFDLWTDKDVYQGARLANSQLIAAELNSPMKSPEAELRVHLALTELGGRATIRNLRRQCRLGPMAYRMIVLLIGKRELDWYPTYKEIDDRTEVFFPVATVSK